MPPAVAPVEGDTFAADLVLQVGQQGQRKALLPVRQVVAVLADDGRQGAQVLVAGPHRSHHQHPPVNVTPAAPVWVSAERRMVAMRAGAAHWHPIGRDGEGHHNKSMAPIPPSRGTQGRSLRSRPQAQRREGGCHMPTTPSQVPAFREIAGVDGLKVADTITSPRGNQFQAIMMGNSLVLTNAAVGTVVATGPGVIDLSVSGIIGGIGDALVDALKTLKGILSCTPQQTTHIDVGPDGKITGITTTNTCVPN